VDRYRIVFQGGIATGQEPAQVKHRLAKLLHTDGARVGALFSGRPVTLKRDLGPGAAARYRKALEDTGAVVEVVSEAAGSGAVLAGGKAGGAPRPAAATDSAVGFRCPKCGAPQEAGETCVQCGIVFRKYAERHGGEQAARFQGSAMAEQSYERLAGLDGLRVKQATERMEAFTGWETRNLYHVGDSAGDWIYEAEEVSGGLVRNFLHSARPFDLTIREMGREEASFVVSRPFRWYFHEVEVFDATGRSIGKIEREFSWLNRVFTVRSAGDAALYRIVGPLWKPWTFIVERGGVEHARIVKQWSGLVREAYTDADNFGVDFGQVTEPRHRALLLAALFLIDFMFFEDSGNENRGFRFGSR
jgi:hypothetical protein